MSHPWQEREDLGYPRAFVGTVWAVLRSPRAFFAATSGSHGVRGPLLFGITAGVIGQIIELLFVVPIVALVARLFDRPVMHVPALNIGSLDLSALPNWALPLLGCQGLFLLIPVIVVIYAVLFLALGGLMHLALRIVGGLRNSKEGFAGTLAVTCYTTAAFPAQLIPVLGDLVFMVLLVILQTIGFRVVHGTTRGKALFATLAPPGLLIAIVATALVRLAGATSG